MKVQDASKLAKERKSAFRRCPEGQGPPLFPPRNTLCLPYDQATHPWSLLHMSATLFNHSQLQPDRKYMFTGYNCDYVFSSFSLSKFYLTRLASNISSDGNLNLWDTKQTTAMPGSWHRTLLYLREKSRYSYWSHLLTFVQRAVNIKCRIKCYSEKDGGRKIRICFVSESPVI